MKVYFSSKIWQFLPVMLCTLLCTMLCAVVGNSPADAHQAADTIFVGGDIITVNEDNPEAEALAVLNGRIVAVGSRDDVFNWFGKETEVVDLGNKTLMPGFYAIHTHPAFTAVLDQWLHINGYTVSSAEEVRQIISDGVAKAKPGEWVTAWGWDPVLTTGLRPPSLKELDEMAPNNPLVILAHNQHNAYVNSIALKIAGITKDSPNPRGGQFVRDEDGNLTGELKEEPAIIRVMEKMPPLSHAQNVKMLKEQFQKYARKGFTTVVDLGLLPVMPDLARLTQEVLACKDTPVRIVAYATGRPDGTINFSHGSGSERFKVNGAKFWADGSPYSGGMAVEEPYLNTELTIEGLGYKKNEMGKLNWPTETLHDAVERYHRDGWQVAIHTQGGRAIDQALDVYESVLLKYPRTDHRHRLEHNMLITPAQLKRATDLGVTSTYLVEHVYFWGKQLRDDILGPERASRIMPMVDAFQYSPHPSMHGDSPLTPLEPLHVMQTAVTRRMRDGGEVLGPEQRIDIDKAITATTIHSAWQVFEEESRGSLEVGKVADMVVLSDNPRKVTPEQLGRIEVLETYLSGHRFVWE